MFTQKMLYSFLSVSLLLVAGVSCPQQRVRLGPGPVVMPQHPETEPLLTTVKTYEGTQQVPSTVHPTSSLATGLSALTQASQVVKQGLMGGGTQKGYTDVTSQFTLSPQLVSKFIKVYRYNDNPMVGYVSIAGRKIGDFTLARPGTPAESHQEVVGRIGEYDVYMKPMTLSGFPFNVFNWVKRKFWWNKTPVRA